MINKGILISHFDNAEFHWQTSSYSRHFECEQRLSLHLYFFVPHLIILVTDVFLYISRPSAIYWHEPPALRSSMLSCKNSGKLQTF